MNRKIFLFTFLCWMFSGVWCFSAERAVVAVIFSSGVEPYHLVWKGVEEFFKQKKVALWSSEYNLKEKQPEEIFSKIKNEKPDIVFAIGSAATRSAKEKIKDIPVVFSMILDPETVAGLNVTGVSMDISARTKLEHVKNIFPDIKNIGIIYSPKLNKKYQEISQAAKELDLKLIAKNIVSGKDLPHALKEISWQIDCFMMIPDSDIYFPKSVEYLLRESLHDKFKVVGLSSYYTRAGALISFDCDYNDLGVQAGEIILRILDGEKPGTIKVLEPRKVNVSLNLMTAERLNVEISENTVKEADVFGGD